MRTEEINNFDELHKRVFNKTSGTICHYTSFESLLMILRNRSLRLTRYDLMNDIAEKQLSKCVDGESRYIISFTGTTSESVAMWALYGKHSGMKLRLECSRSSLIHTADNNFYFDPVQTDKIGLYQVDKVANDYTKKTFSLSDVVYYDRKRNKLRLSGKPLNEITVTDVTIKELAGTVKYDAWEYEKETRLSVILRENSRRKDIRYVYLGLSDDFIKKLTITYSPWTSLEMIEELSKVIDTLAGFPLKHKKSELFGEIGAL